MNEMMTVPLVVTQAQAAEFFEVSEKTVRDIARGHKLEPKAMGHNGKAKGHDMHDLRVIAKSLGRPAPTVADLNRFLATA